MTETQDDIFDQDRFEDDIYADASVDQEIPLPLTKLGFEALLAELAARNKLPLDDAARATLAGYVHHIPREQNTSTLAILGKVLHKAVSNAITWRIDQEIKIKHRELEKAAKEAALKAKEESTSLALVETSDAPPTQGA